MINLQLPKEADSDSTMLGASETEHNDYGYGTKISLEEEQVTALGIGTLAIGQRVKITAFGVIASLDLDVGDPTEGTGPDMCIQLTDMEVGKASSIDATAMYPSSNG